MAVRDDGPEKATPIVRLPFDFSEKRGNALPAKEIFRPSPCGERWEAMTPAGCHRACAKCDRVVHDLAQYDVADVEKLLRDEPGSCVRASIDASGTVATKAVRHGNIRRMVAVVGASAGLLMSPPMLAGHQRKDGAIIGSVLPYRDKTMVTAKDGNGNFYRAKVKSNGRYHIKHVPPGVYDVEFSSKDCDASWVVPGITVGAGEVVTTDESDNNEFYIVVGLLEIDNGER